MTTVLDIDVSELSGTDLTSFRFVHLSHPGDDNIIRLSRRDQRLKEALLFLTAKGFVVYKFVNQGTAVTSFVHVSRAPRFWVANTHTGLQEHGGICYRLAQPEGGVVRRLLVVFSSIAPGLQMYDAGLSARIFCQNFRQASKYVPWDTAILRIADLGGVVGAYYTDTLAQPGNEDRIAALIEKVVSDLGVDRSQVVLYGISKGASGALLHSLRTGLKAVCVEPILSDDHYIRRYRDSHFTEGLFPQEKHDLFAARLEAPAPDADRVVIHSSRSPQQPYIRGIGQASQRGREMAFIDVQSPAIQDHVDVGVATLGLQVSLINQMLYGLPLQQGHLDAIRASSRA